MRSAALSLACVAAVLCGIAGPAFVATPQRGPASAADATQAVAQPALAAANAVLLASMPVPAHAGGMFDFGLTLPFVAFTFLAMMFVLNTLWYAPVTSEMDERNEKLLQTLSEATDNLTKADEIQVEYTESIRQTREKAAAAVAQYKKMVESKYKLELEQAQAKSEADLAKLEKELEKEIEAKKAAAEGEIERRKSEFVKKTFSSMSL